MPTADCKTLGEELLRQPVKRVNNVTILLKLSVSGNEAECRAATHYLKLFFLAAFERGDLSVNTSQAAKKADDAQAKLGIWLQQRLDAFVAQLHALLQTEHRISLQISALNTLLELVRGQQLGTFSQPLFASTAAVLLGSKSVASETLQAFQSKYLQYVDVRFYLLRALPKTSQEGAAMSIAANADSLAAEDLAERLFTVLTAIAPALQAAGAEEAAVPSWCGAIEAGLAVAAADRVEGSQQRKKRKRVAQLDSSPAPLLGGVQWANPAAYKRAYSDAWLGLLRLPLPSHLLKQVLVQLHSSVMPSLPTPLLLADFLTSCLDQGGMLGILALNGIFTLVTKHGLEYPAFYARLYALLQAPVFRAKYRARFLQLTDIFLSSSMVPAYTAAAFIKKFARLALTAPPAGAIIAIAFIHNLLRRHPSCSMLVHRPPKASLSPESGPSPASASSVHNHLHDGSKPSHQPSVSLTNGIHTRRPVSQQANPASANPHSTQNGLPGHAESDSDGDTPAASAAAQEAASGGQVACEDVNGQQHSTDTGAADGEDVFDEQALDPARSRAIESSLWEVESLRQHSYHTVATYVTILDRDLGDRKKTAEVDVTALLKSSYSSLLTLEIEKRLKAVPIAFYPEPPAQLFPLAGQADFPGWAL